MEHLKLSQYQQKILSCYYFNKLKRLGWICISFSLINAEFRAAYSDESSSATTRNKLHFVYEDNLAQFMLPLILNDGRVFVVSPFDSETAQAISQNNEPSIGITIHEFNGAKVRVTSDLVAGLSFIELDRQKLGDSAFRVLEKNCFTEAEFSSASVLEAVTIVPPHVKYSQGQLSSKSFVASEKNFSSHTFSKNFDGNGLPYHTLFPSPRLFHPMATVHSRFDSFGNPIDLTGIVITHSFYNFIDCFVDMGTIVKRLNDSSNAKAIEHFTTRGLERYLGCITNLEKDAHPIENWFSSDMRLSRLYSDDFLKARMARDTLNGRRFASSMISLRIGQRFFIITDSLTFPFTNSDSVLNWQNADKIFQTEFREIEVQSNFDMLAGIQIRQLDTKQLSKEELQLLAKVSISINVTQKFDAPSEVCVVCLPNRIFRDRFEYSVFLDKTKVIQSGLYSNIRLLSQTPKEFALMLVFDRTATSSPIGIACTDGDGPSRLITFRQLYDAINNSN